VALACLLKKVINVESPCGENPPPLPEEGGGRGFTVLGFNSKLKFMVERRKLETFDERPHAFR